MTGDAARLMDLQDRLEQGLPLAVMIVVLAMMVVLFLMTGSVVVGIKAVVISALSLAATFGVLTAVFQDGWLSWLLGTLTVRCVLSPALMTMLGRAAWWAPAPLRSLHRRVGLRESDAPELRPVGTPGAATVEEAPAEAKFPAAAGMSVTAGRSDGAGVSDEVTGSRA